MKKLVKIVAVAVLMANSATAFSLEEYSNLISFNNNPAAKQTFRCAREAEWIKKDPMECINATKFSLEEVGDIANIYGGYKNYIGEQFYYAGIIYDKIGDNANEVKMYKKALEFSPNQPGVNLDLGVAYYSGKGVEIDKVKAYEHWRVAAKQGHKSAQNNLDILCKESPWACK